MKTIEERATDFALKEIRCESVEELECWGTEVAKKAFEEIRSDYIRIAAEQKAMDEDAIHAIVEEQVLKAIEKQKAIDDKEYTNEMQQLNEEWKENLVIQRAMLIDKAVAWVDHNVGTLSAIALRKAMEGEK